MIRILKHVIHCPTMKLTERGIELEQVVSITADKVLAHKCLQLEDDNNIISWFSTPQ